MFGRNVHAGLKERDYLAEYLVKEGSTVSVISDSGVCS